MNGEFYAKGESREPFRGLVWEHWLGDESLKKTELKIRSSDIIRSHDPGFESQPDDVRPLDIPEDP